MIATLAAILALAGPLAAGWLIVARLAPQLPRGLHLPLACATGMGATGTVYFAALSWTDSSVVGLAASECFLAIVLLSLRRRKTFAGSPLHPHSEPTAGRWMQVVLWGTLVISAASFLFLLDYSRQGGWDDAVTMWNFKARMIYLSDSEPIRRLADPALMDTHPDYPLLLPSLIARGWHYMGSDSRWMSLAMAALFTMTTFAITVEGIRKLTGTTQALLAGALLASTPFFLEHGASQYADIVLCCFMTASVVLFSLWDSGVKSRGLLPLAGLLAGFAACTKNEGIVFLLVIAGARLLLRRGFGELPPIGLGAAPGLIALWLFKMIVPANDIAGHFSLGLALQRFQMLADHAMISRTFLEGFRFFGKWWIYPILLMLAHVLVARIGTGARRPAAGWAMPALVLLGMLAGYYAAYVVTPHDLATHLNTSITRLLLQVWPIALVLYAILSSTGSGQDQPNSDRDADDRSW